MRSSSDTKDIFSSQLKGILNNKILVSKNSAMIASIDVISLINIEYFQGDYLAICVVPDDFLNNSVSSPSHLRVQAQNHAQ